MCTFFGGDCVLGFYSLKTEEKLSVAEKQLSMLFLCQEIIIFIQNERF